MVSKVGLVPLPISSTISSTDKTHHTQPAGCNASRTVEVFAVAWDQHHLDRNKRVLQAWASRDTATVATRAVGLRQAIGDAGRDAVERHGGLDVIVEKIDQWEQKNPASNGRGMIDDFRLWGSRTWRRMGDTVTNGGWRRQVVHDFDNYKSALSEGAPLAVVVEAILGNPHWTRVGTDCPSPLR